MAASSRLSHLKLPVKRKNAAQAAAQVSESIAPHAVGTWMYMILCVSPMCTSAGATTRP